MMETMEQKTERNCRVQARYDELMRAGRHGHYETMFRVVREEVATERERSRLLIEECRVALAEELSAWAIDPPLHHVQQAHEKCVVWLARQAEDGHPNEKEKF